MHSVEALMAQANARLRAWEAVGVPVRARWTRREGPPLEWSHYDWRLDLECTVCNRHRWISLLENGAGGLSNLSARERAIRIEQCESAAARSLEDKYHCSHLERIRDDAPPEVVEIAALELLAGEPAHG